jgi:hypothetical protein
MVASHAFSAPIGAGRGDCDRIHRPHPLSPRDSRAAHAVDGRWSRFAGSADDFDASKGFILTWVVQYASSAEAAAVFPILRNELESEAHYGWGTGEYAGLGDGGTCLEGDNPLIDLCADAGA